MIRINSIAGRGLFFVNFAILFFAWHTAIVSATDRYIPSDTIFKAIDLTNIQLTPKNIIVPDGTEPTNRLRGVEPSPWIVWRNIKTNEYGVWIMTLNSQTGVQMGNRLQMTLPALNTPVDILWAWHFAYPYARGVEPTPWIVFRDYMLYTFPISHGLDGTPVAGTPVTVSPAVNPLVYGYAVCATELPGSEFTDGKDRLFIGSDRGYIIVLASAIGAGIVVTDIFPISTAPIIDLQPIPQFGFIALGAVADNAIKGIHYFSGSKDGSRAGTFSIIFTLPDPRPQSPLNFDTFGPHDAQLPDSQSTVKMVIANGTNNLGLSTITSYQNGLETLNIAIDPHPAGIKAVVSGSLLMLPTDELAVEFDPDYSQDTGYSGCEVNITDGIKDICGFLCRDVNDNGTINALDITFLINYLYKHGPVPNHLQAADVNNSGAIDALDITYLINYLYKHGLAPNCP